MLAIKEDFTNTIKNAYKFYGISIPLGFAILYNDYFYDTIIRLPLSTLNRHGLISGATGTGKTKTLQMMTEQLSRNGVSCILMDLKGDLSGLAIAGNANAKIEERKTKLSSNYPFDYEDFPVNFLSLGEDTGISLKATVDNFGSVLLSKVLRLNNVQTGIISIAFKYCADNKLKLNTLEDLKFLLTRIFNDNKDLQEEYGNIAQNSIATILRNIAELEEQGGNLFIGEPAFNINDFISFDNDGKGYLSIIRLTKIQDKPFLFSTFILYLLTKIYNTLPETGDVAKPKLVLFIDEAHLLFDRSNKVTEEKLEIIIKLIRSKGVSLIFCTQTPSDISESVLGQLGLKIQHALRAFTPNDRKSIKLMANNFPESKFYNLEEDLTSLGIGEAFVTILNEKGIPTPVVKTMIAPPVSRMGILDEVELKECINKSPLLKKYGLLIKTQYIVNNELSLFYNKIQAKMRIETQANLNKKKESKRQLQPINNNKKIKSKTTSKEIKNAQFMKMFSNFMGLNTIQNQTNQQYQVNHIQYYISNNGQQMGPYSYNDINNMILTNQINKFTYLWKTGMTNWLTIAEFSEF